MATNTINAELLTRMFLAGAANLEAKKEFINELNVFLVTGRSTGTKHDFNDHVCRKGSQRIRRKRYGFRIKSNFFRLSSRSKRKFRSDSFRLFARIYKRNS